jgi:hypothetical protein
MKREVRAKDYAKDGAVLKYWTMLDDIISPDEAFDLLKSMDEYDDNDGDNACSFEDNQRDNDLEQGGDTPTGNDERVG